MVRKCNYSLSKGQCSYAVVISKLNRGFLYTTFTAI